MRIARGAAGALIIMATTIPAIKPAAKRKPNTKAAAASSGNGGAATDSKGNSSKTP